MSNKKIKKMKNSGKIRTERLMQIFLWAIGFLSALLLDAYPTAAIIIAVAGAALVTFVVTLQVVNYKEWHPSKPSTFWCASAIGAALALILLLVLIKFSVLKLTTAGIVMIAILPSVTPIIGVLIANIIRVCKKEKAVFIV